MMLISLKKRFSDLDQTNFSPYILLYKKKSHNINNKQVIPCGLKNGGKSYRNTCYGNSTLQLLFTVPEIKEVIDK